MKVHFCLFLTSCFLLVKTERIVINKGSFSVVNKNRIVVSEFTTDQIVTTRMMCAIRCFSEEKCCVASYNKSTSTCRLDTSENCCVDMEIVDGWETFKTDKYESPCIGCISYGTSSYKFSEDHKSWNGAKMSCVCLGGKFLEAETTEENNFIKAELMALNTGINGYWLGGYNFDKDGNLEWISNSDQPMTYSDMNTGEPSGPTTERCLVYWRAFGYSWGDAYCSAKLPYVCEFFKTKISMNINLSYGVCLLYFYGVQGRAEKNFVIKVGYKPLP